MKAALSSIKREHAYRLPFVPFGWVYIVDAAPISLVFDLRAPRRGQMIEQVRQRVFRPITGDQIGAAECCLPGTFAARDQNGRTRLIGEGVVRSFNHPPATVAMKATRNPASSRPRVCQHISPPMFARGLL